MKQSPQQKNLMHKAKETMKRLFATAIFISLISSTATAAPAEEKVAPTGKSSKDNIVCVADRVEPLSVSATYSDGESGTLWWAHLAPDGDLVVKVLHEYPSAQTISSYLSNKNRIFSFRRALEEACFFQLPPFIPPVSRKYDWSIYTLTVTLGAKEYSVQLDQPESVVKKDDLRRFFVVWDALFSELPFKPLVFEER